MEKIDEKLKGLLPYLFAIFCLFFKNEISAWLKMDEKLRLLGKFPLLIPIFKRLFSYINHL
jgi:hypothetical protein